MKRESEGSAVDSRKKIEAGVIPNRSVPVQWTILQQTVNRNRLLAVGPVRLNPVSTKPGLALIAPFGFL